MRAPLIAIVLSSASTAAYAQPANGTVTSVEACIQLASAAASACYDPRVDAVESCDWKKTRASLDECLAHAARSTRSEAPAAPGSSEMPSGTISLEMPSAISPDKSSGIGAPSSPDGAVPSKKPSATVLPEKPTRTLAPKVPTAARPVGTRSADGSIVGMESCFQAARIADAICFKLLNDPAQRLDCFQKAGAAQLECLDRVLSETPTSPTTPKAPSETTRHEPPAAVTLPEAPSERVPPNRQIDSSEKSDSRSNAIRPNPPELPAPSETPTGEIPSDSRPATADVPVRPPGTNWVVSETTSPVDYSPLVTAIIGSTSRVKNAPTTLAVRCREKHTELLVRTDGTWIMTRGKELRVDYQINDQPAVTLPWTASADGKTASYKNDAVGLLQSLPEGAQLKINVFDGPGPGHDATFQLAGLDTVRKKIAAACNSRQ
jgi:hypothetical protein